MAWCLPATLESAYSIHVHELWVFALSTRDPLYHVQGGGGAVRIFSHFQGRSLSVMFKRKYSSGIVHSH